MKTHLSVDLQSKLMLLLHNIPNGKIKPLLNVQQSVPLRRQFKWMRRLMGTEADWHPRCVPSTQRLLPDDTSSSQWGSLDAIVKYCMCMSHKCTRLTPQSHHAHTLWVCWCLDSADRHDGVGDEEAAIVCQGQIVTSVTLQLLFFPSLFLVVFSSSTTIFLYAFN